MPRPKLKRVKPSADTAPSTKIAPHPTVASQKKHVLREQSDSTDSDRLVRRVRRSTRENDSSQDNSAFMSGALPSPAARNAANEKQHESISTRRVRRSLNQEEMVKSIKHPRQSLRAHREKKTTAADVFGWSQEEMAPSPVASKEDPTTTRQPLKDVAPGSAKRNMPRIAPVAPATAKKPATANVPATPSFINLANFKRRPRQPSLLTMVQNAESRRQSASIVADGTDADANLASEFGDDDALEHALEKDLDGEPTPTSSSKKRKRTSPADKRFELTPGSSPSDAAQHVELQAAPQADDAEDDLLVEDSQPKRLRSSNYSSHSPSDEREPSRSRSRSPSLPLPTTTPQRQPNGLNLRGQRSPPELSPFEATSPISTPPSSPQKQRRKSTKARETKPKEKPKPLKTADLTALLPKRRTRRRRPPVRDEFTVMSDSADESGHESSEPDVNGSEDELAGKAHKPSKSKRGRPPLRKSGNAKLPTPSKSGKGNKGPKRKYGRASDAAYDGDNGDEVNDHDETVLEEGGRNSRRTTEKASKEIEEAKKKFEEVDKWELSFESADIGAGGSSSPWR